MTRHCRGALFLLLAMLVLCASSCSDSEDREGSTIQAEEAGEATIYRDSFGVPHVYADTPGALFFGFGYAMAEDRLFQMEFTRRIGAGTLAEVLGADYLQYDQDARTYLQPDEWFEQSYRALEPEYQLIYQAYADGINYYIEQAREDPFKRPFECILMKIDLEPFTTTDLFKIGLFLADRWGTKGGSELENLALYEEWVRKYGEEDARRLLNDVLPQNDPEAYVSLPETTLQAAGRAAGPARSSSRPSGARPDVLRSIARRLGDFERMRDGFVRHASCAIAISPERSASGNVLMTLCTADGAEVHLNGAGFDVAGYTFPGNPALSAGRSTRYVWQTTVGFSDMIDTYAEKLNPENRYQYEYMGSWRDMERRTETIRVRNQAPVELEVCRTVHGPVIGWDPESNVAYAQRHAGSERGLAIVRTLLDMHRTRSFEEFERAVKTMEFNVNVVYGDDEGNIAYWFPGLHPVRPAHVDSRLPASGTGEDEWLGYIPQEELPYCLNPEQGYLVSWNNQPTRTWEAGDYGRWGKTFHVYKPVELVEADPSISWDELHEIHKQIARSWGHVEDSATKKDFYVPHLLAAAGEGGDPEVLEAVSHVQEWNGSYEDADGDRFYDSVGLTIFRKWMPLAVKRILADELGERSIEYGYDQALLLRALEGGQSAFPTAWDFFNGEDRNVVVRETVRDAVEELEAEYGTSDMSAWKHPIFWRDYTEDPMMGASALLGFVESVPHPGAADYTQFIELSRAGTTMETIIPSGGQSWFIDLLLRPSPHINDQAPMWAAFQYKPMHFERADVEANAESVKELTYPPSPASPCFIATAALGTDMAGKTDLLRTFRDTRLHSSEWGRRLVSAYYEYSPPWADAIRRHPWLKKIVSALLMPVVGFAWLLV
ncbi:MAG: penicillin acylase family protein [bacterium]